MFTAVCPAGWCVLDNCRLGAFNYDSLPKVSKSQVDMLGHAPEIWCSGVAACWDAVYGTLIREDVAVLLN